MHLQRVEQFHPGNRDSGLQHSDHGRHRRRHRGELAHRGHRRLWQAVELELHLGDQPEHAFAANVEPGEVQARGGFARPPARVDDLPTRRHHGQAQHILPHRAVADGRGAGSAGGGHAAQGRVGAGIDGKKQAARSQFGVECAAGDPRLHPAIHRLRGNSQHGVHAREVHAHAALQRRDLALERGSGAPGHDRKTVFGASGSDPGHLFIREGKGDQVRQARRRNAFPPRVLVPQRGGPGQPLAQHRLQPAEHGVGGIGGVLQHACSLHRRAENG